MGASKIKIEKTCQYGICVKESILLLQKFMNESLIQALLVMLELEPSIIMGEYLVKRSSQATFLHGERFIIQSIL